MEASPGGKQSARPPAASPVPCQESPLKQGHLCSRAGTSNTSRADSELSPLAGT